MPSSEAWRPLLKDGKALVATLGASAGNEYEIRHFHDDMSVPRFAI
ncbi:MAG: hypothetical protein NTW21_13480 [Verrucomicrobia bacterium]|nr:hypothetical protein [Verrucomicrobiota bacterium]